MGNGAFSRATRCFVHSPNDKENNVGLDLRSKEPFDEGLGHSFCYIHPHLFPLELHTCSLDGQSLDSESFATRRVKNPSKTTFKTISGASVSANTSTPRTFHCNDRFHSFTGIADARHAAFESTASFISLPLQPIPRGSAPLGPSLAAEFTLPTIEHDTSSRLIEHNLLSGPLERGFMSGPLERSFMSGPLEGGSRSGHLEKGFGPGLAYVSTDRSHFSAPLAESSYRHCRRLRWRMSVAHIITTMGKPMKSVLTRTFSKTSSSLAATHKSFVASFKQLVSQDKTKELQNPPVVSYPSLYLDSKGCQNLQWAQGKAGEDRVQVVVSEEHGWLFIGIYDGFNGPEAPDFIMNNLYRCVYKELQGLLWDQNENADVPQKQDKECVQMSASCLNYEGHLEGAKNRMESHLSCGTDMSTSTFIENVDGSRSLQRSLDDKTNHQNGPFKSTVTLKELLEAENTTVSFDGYQSGVLFSQNKIAGSMAICRIDDSAVGSCDECANKQVSATCSHEETPKVLDEASTVAINRLNTGRPTRMGKFSFQSRIRIKFGKEKESHRKFSPRRCNVKCIDGTSNAGSKQNDSKQGRQSSIDHKSVLKALAHALKVTEDAFLDMVERALQENPELALMGSCVLVVLMKDKDVYVMNVGDSRAVLAQCRTLENDSHQIRNDLRCIFSSSKQISADKAGSIYDQGHDFGQESPGNLNCRAYPPTSNQSWHALQLSRDHSTSIEEEIARIKTEHPNDSGAILNNRVKGILKVTRAFGAGFLKKPKWNDALLRTFQVDYVGCAPYVSCAPDLHHHRLGPDDQCLILSSDGLYQYFSNEEVVSYVKCFMERFPEGDPAQHLIEELLFRAAKKAGMDFHELLDIPQGDRRKFHDDVSVMIISLEGRIWKYSS